MLVEFGARTAFPIPQLVNLTGSRLPSLGRADLPIENLISLAVLMPGVVAIPRRSPFPNQFLTQIST